MCIFVLFFYDTHFILNSICWTSSNNWTVWTVTINFADFSSFFQSKTFHFTIVISPFLIDHFGMFVLFCLNRFLFVMFGLEKIMQWTTIMFVRPSISHTIHHERHHLHILTPKTYLIVVHSFFFFKLIFDVGIFGIENSGYLIF